MSSYDDVLQDLKKLEKLGLIYSDKGFVRPNIARVIFNSLFDVIKEKLNSGYSVNLLYKYLRKENQLPEYIAISSLYSFIKKNKSRIYE